MGYSGKKKRHTLKTEIRITRKGRIVHVSKTKPGSVHDFNLHKQEPPLPLGSRAYVDSGYQGLDKLHPETEIPYKATKKKPFPTFCGEQNGEEKEYTPQLTIVGYTTELCHGFE